MGQSIRGLVFAAAATLAVGAACGDGTRSGLPPETQLSELDQDQRTQFCEANSDYLWDTFSDADVACSVLAYVFATDEEGTKASCETMRSQCMAQFNPAAFGDREYDCSSSSTSAYSCSATVQELEDCIDAAVGILAGLGCDDVGREPPPPPTECVAMFESCDLELDFDID